LAFVHLSPVSLEKASASAPSLAFHYLLFSTGFSHSSWAEPLFLQRLPRIFLVFSLLKFSISTQLRLDFQPSFCDHRLGFFRFRVPLCFFFTYLNTPNPRWTSTSLPLLWYIPSGFPFPAFFLPPWLSASDPSFPYFPSPFLPLGFYWLRVLPGSSRMICTFLLSLGGRPSNSRVLSVSRL